MTDNEFVGKYQNALSNLCGVEYAYMQGDPDVDAIAELITVAVKQKAEIERLQNEVSTLKHKMSYMINPNTIGDRHEMGCW